MLAVHLLASRVHKFGEYLRMDVAAGQNRCDALAGKFMPADRG
jgi:hypothetical protein